MYINGKNSVLEAVRAGERVEKVYFLYGAQTEGLGAIRNAAKQAGIPCTTLDRNTFRDLEKKGNLKTKSQGVIARINPILFVDIEDVVTLAWETGRTPLVAALDGITDPRNLGAILRSAECAGLSGVVFSKAHSSGVNDVAVKTSAGAAHFVPISRVRSITETLSGLKEMGMQVVGLDAGGEMSYTDIDYTEPTVIVVGSEGEGMDPRVAAACDQLVSIPLKGSISSLNASVAAGIVFYEAVRQREG